MRLSTIKLSGFKSFVDPTTLHLPTNMTGVVGPNGCGKSNIIDAVRWVLGESSASKLRGDSLTDVIFSGSTSRKPVGTATVELIFDNGDGQITGEYASYAEISVKRSASRDGQSIYMLNGARCRRRDITDLFLGTGLGPRSYSIIEQGMISQIVEAAPEDLRNHLEEAAGISKYKERRRETETRIRHTRENLARLDDVRQEVDKQLEHLRRQARQAERYQELRAEQRSKDAALKAAQFRALEGQREALKRQLGEAETALEALIAQQRNAEARIEARRQDQHAASDALNLAQGEVYKVGSELARVEQQIRHQREMDDRLRREQAEAESALRELGEHIASDETQIETLAMSLADDEPRLEAMNEEAEARAEAQREADAHISDWQMRWDSHTRDAGESIRAAEVERTRIDYLDRQLVNHGRRVEALELERKGLDPDALAAELEHIETEQETRREQVEALSERVETLKLAYESQLQQRRSFERDLAAAREALTSAKGRRASLEALQAAALGQDQRGLRDWLEQQGLSGARRLGQALRVTEGWERAVEIVLGPLVEAVLHENPARFAAASCALQDDGIYIFDTREDAAPAPAGTLASVVRGPASALGWLRHVRLADDLEQAQALLGTLAPGESVICLDGTWLGPDWLRQERGRDQQLGVLARERELVELASRIETLELNCEELAEQVAQAAQQIQQAERERDTAQQETHAAHRALAEIGGQINSRRGRIDSVRTRADAIDRELAQLRTQIEQDENGAREARGKLETSVSRMADAEETRLRLEGERRSLLEARENARHTAKLARDAAHQLALAVESRRTARRSLEQALQRLSAQQQQLTTRCAELREQLAAGDDPVRALEAERQLHLDQRSLCDQSLARAREHLEGIEIELRDLEHTRQKLDRDVLAQREAQNRLKLDEQALELRAQTLDEAIQKAEFVIAELLAALPEEFDMAAAASELDDLEQKIRRLEPVNLAAIQEYAQQSERKEYLDAQSKDLSDALETLEEAIRKIDRETRTRFKETFDKVNAGVQEIFPRLFGGGHGYLELTGDDLLSTGVQIMARPPGKRVSSISLLSGGEKALTAVSLVFAIFRLNPAPFCLLDEVDAPLDEANVGRFCNLVREMSEQVQFLFVSHNKATMEAAQQLAGVTMREPGVSRLVQVDLAEAEKLAGAA